MYLSKLIIINYRSCKSLCIDLLKDAPNVFIGVNDCGKSTVLKAIGLLLEEKPQFNFVKDSASKKDFSNSPLTIERFSSLMEGLELPLLNYEGNKTFIIGKFLLEDADLLESNFENFGNQLAWAVESAERELWLAREFIISNNNYRSYLLTKDQLGSDGLPVSFFSLPDRELQKRRTEYTLTKDDVENANGVGRYTKLELIRALYNKIGSIPVWSEYKVEPSFFPKFRYLDWNMSFDDIMKSATDALSSVIEAYIGPLKQEAITQQQEAEVAINERLRSVAETISEIAPITQLKTRVQFTVQEKITDILVTKPNSDGDIHIDLQGDGLKRQIWFALVKATLQLENNGGSEKKFIWAFDEPETHLYPSAQRRFFDIIKQLNQRTVQTIISTHSTVFIDKSNLESIKCFQQEPDSYTSFYSCTAVDDVYLSLDLRNSDFLFFDKFLVIEGQTEHFLIPGLYKIYSDSLLKDDNIQLINLNGASNWIMQKNSLESVLTGFKKSLDDVVYIFDNDQKYKIGEGAIHKNLCFIGKQDIEDAINNSIWVNIVATASEGKFKITEDDVQKIKDEIPGNAEIESNRKFFPRLEAFCKLKLQEATGEPVTWNVLPRKGEPLAKAILEQVNTEEDIPSQVLDAFRKMRAEVIVEDSVEVAGLQEVS